MSIEIRRLIAADAEAYHGLRLRSLTEHPEAFLVSADEEAGLDTQRERLAAKEQRDDDFILGAFDGARGWSSSHRGFAQ